MIKDFKTYINEGLFDRNQSEFNIRKTDRGVEHVYIPSTKEELYKYIDIAIENAKKDRTYPNVNLNNIDISELGNDELKGLFSKYAYAINPDISDWDIKSIPRDFFYRNEQIKEYIIPDSVTIIEDSAFECCNGLKSVTIPNSVTRIGSFSFKKCNSLTSVTIPNSVTRIGVDAFNECSNLTSVTIPNNVTIIGGGAFFKCSSLTFPVYNAHVFVYMPTSYSGAYTIPDGIESIAYQAFFQCSGLTSVTIPNSVTRIGEDAFAHCYGLTSVTIPNSVTRIGDYAFQYCRGLKSVTIGNSVKSIGEKAFDGCESLTSVIISKICYIDEDSFPENCKIIRKDD